MRSPVLTLKKAALAGVSRRSRIDATRRLSIVAVTSSSPLRRMTPHAISYVAARAAQNAFVRSAGHELAAHGVRLNAIAQNFVENDTYYPPSIMDLSLIHI